MADPTLIEFITSAATSGIIGNFTYDILKAKLPTFLKPALARFTKQSDNELDAFVAAVFDAAEKAAKACGVSLDDEREGWDMKRVQRGMEVEQDVYHVPDYLPDYPPLLQLGRLLGDYVLLVTNDSGKERAFRAEFNTRLQAIADDPVKFPALAHVRRQGRDAQLREHLEKVRSESLFRLSPETPELTKAYVEPRALLCSADDWQSIRTNALLKRAVFPEVEKDAADLLEEYFETRKFTIPDHSISYPVLVVGADFGIGKSSFSRMAASRLAARCLALEPEAPIPVFLPLRSCQGRIDTIRDHLRDRGLFRTDGPRLRLFLDGLDESGEISPEHMQQFFRFIQALKSDLPPNSQIIISSRLVLGPSGAVADFIRNTLGGSYLRLLGLNGAQVAGWFTRNVAAQPDAIRHPVPTVGDLRKLELAEGEWSKPLYLWMISRLLQSGELKLDGEMPLGRAGLYMRLMNMASREAKPRAPHGHREHCSSEAASELEASARLVLQHLAALRNQQKDACGLNEETIHQSFVDNSPEQKSYKKLGEARFLALSYFGHHGKQMEFTHTSFREYLLAEYLLGVLLCAAAKGSQPERIRLSVGHLSFETINFLEGLCKGVGGWLANSQPMPKAMVEPFIHALSQACTPLKYQIQTAESRAELFDQVLTMSKSWVIDPTSYTLFPASQRQQSDTVLGSHVQAIGGSIRAQRFGQERLLSLFMATHLLGGAKRGVLFEQDNWRLALDIMRDLIDIQASLDWLCPFVSANFTGFNLSRLNLKHINFSKTKLSDADLEHAALNWANIAGANLSGAYMDGANLRGANLSGANLSRANLQQANLSEVNLSRANLSGAYLTAAKLIGADLTAADLNGANLSRADLSRADLSRANLSGAYLENAILDEALGLPD